MWESNLDGRTLHFHLVGINNQNFIMRDEETGSWWQQVTGECLLGPLRGRRLKLFDHDELTFATWRRENPHGRVLRPEARVAAAGDYAPADWEARMTRVPVATNAPGTSETFAPRTLVVGLTSGGAAKAYPLDALRRQSPILDAVGDTPVLLVVGEDGRSVRAFARTIDGHALDFFRRAGDGPWRLIDAATGSEWDFTGTAQAGPLAGRQLTRLNVLEDYWFDWKTHHPETAAYTLGEP